MPDYVVLFPADNEVEWEAASESERQATYDADLAFSQSLKSRGGTISGGAALAPSSAARTITRSANGEVRVGHGPHRVSEEQLSGFFTVSCEDMDTLAEAAVDLLAGHPVIEIRLVEA